jgi:hypothetical protein
MTDEVLKTLLAILAAGGGGAAIAWAIFAKFGDRWLKHRFEKRLEMFKHEEAKELEHLRHQITSLFSRISKIHEKEFEILPIAFLNLHKAYGACFDLGSELQRVVTLDRMGDSHFAEFVEACRLPAFRKQELKSLNGADRDEYYRRWIFWTDLIEAKSLHNDFHNFVVMNRIFMTEGLRKQFVEIDRLISSVLGALEIDRQTPGSGLLADARVELAKIRPLLDLLETAIQKRLHYDDA